jgi:hypothetical protein
VDRHILAKRSHLFGETGLGFCAQAVYPELKCLARCSVESLPFLRFQLVGKSDWGQLRCVQDLIRIGVADTAYQPGVG